MKPGSKAPQVPEDKIEELTTEEVEQHYLDTNSDGIRTYEKEVLS